MATGYSQRLLQRAELASDLIQLLQKQKTFSYQRLAELIGVERGDLRYFVGASKGGSKGPTEATNMKIAKFAQIMDWIENTGFDNPFYTNEQRKVAKHIKATFVRDQKSELYETIGSGFDLNNHANPTKDLSQFLGYYVGYRKRGTTKLVSSFSLKIYLDRKQQFCQWEAKFLEGKSKIDNFVKFRRDQMRTHLVRGHALLEEGNLTCVGRRVNTNEMYFVNLMQPETERGFLWGLFSSFSRDEAIARPVCLVRRPDIGEENYYELDDELDDFYAEDIASKLPIDVGELDFDFSVSRDGPVAEGGFQSKN